jgi:hypothetical protein
LKRSHRTGGFPTPRRRGFGSVAAVSTAWQHTFENKHSEQ